MGLTWSPAWAAMRRTEIDSLPQTASKPGVKLSPLILAATAPQLERSASVGAIGARRRSLALGSASPTAGDPALAASLPGVLHARRKLEELRTAVAIHNGGATAFRGDHRPADERPTRATWKSKKKQRMDASRRDSVLDSAIVRDPALIDSASLLPGVTHARKSLHQFATIARDPAAVEALRLLKEADAAAAAVSVASANVSAEGGPQIAAEGLPTP